MTKINIPPAALEAGRTAAEKVYGTQFFNEEIEAAFTAMVEAWPGMSQLAENDSASIREMPALILPLPQEASDE